MESPTKEIEEFESTALKYLQPEQIEKIWLRLRGLWVYPLLFFSTSVWSNTVHASACLNEAFDV